MAYGGHASSLRVHKVNKIFSKFDLNGDGHLNREEMAALVVAVNPKVEFDEEQIAAILDEIFRTYGDYIDGDQGLSFDGLLQTYHDGAGDIDRDFNALGLKVDFETEAPKKEEQSGNYAALASSAEDSSRKKAALGSAESPKNDIRNDDTWNLTEELEALIRQVENKMNEKIRSDGQGRDSYTASVGWVRDMGSANGSATSEVLLARRPWEELGQEYVQFKKGMAEIRTKADRLPTQEEVFDAHMAAGRTLFDHRLFKEAIVSFRRASELKPPDMRPLFQQGNALYALGRVSDAREAYIKALEAGEADMDVWGPLLPQVQVNLGIALETEGLLLSASEHYKEAVIKEPKHYRALKLLGSALFGVGEYKAAQENLMEAISLHPDYADAHCELGLVLHALGDHDQARMEFQKALDLRSDHVEALYNLATLLKDMGQYGRAAGTYLKVLALQPGNWRAQLNRAVALLGTGDVDESKRAFKQAYKMTGRSELYDAMLHLQNRNKISGEENFGGEDFFVVEPARFKTANGRTTTRQWLSYALDIRDFQKCTRLNRCDVANLKKELSQAPLTASPAHVGMSEKLIRKEDLEKVIRSMLHFLKPDAFRGAMKVVNEKILSVLDPTGSGRVDIAMVSAILAPVCGGSLNRRKRTVYDALVLHSSRNIDGEISRQDAKQYLKLLRTVYLPAQEESKHGAFVGNHQYASLSFLGFVEMFDNPDSGFGILNVVAKLEMEDHVRHGGHMCSVCCYPIIGPRFRETKLRFSLCSLCYSSGKVPSTAKHEELFYFKEYNSELEAAKDKLLSFKKPLSCSEFSR